MNPLTLEWVEKAEGDFVTARRELKVRISPNYDAVCFHSQQATEKYLKAVLQENGINIPKTHQLMDLLALCVKTEGTYQLIYPDLMTLEGYAIKFRYPGETAEKVEGKRALKSATVVREFIRTRLGLPD
jgi:HEPN domain-containing protein